MFLRPQRNGVLDLVVPPIDQFADGHGFTGLVYLTHPTAGGDYQLFCRAVRA